jgi:tRNA A37 threonylcarbamoyltransferase TsaD
MKLHEHPAVRDMCGGAAIGHLAADGDEHRYQLITSHYSAKMKDCSFSFGGILTHTQRVIEKEDIRYGKLVAFLTSDISHSTHSHRQVRRVPMNRN